MWIIMTKVIIDFNLVLFYFQKKTVRLVPDFTTRYTSIKLNSLVADFKLLKFLSAWWRYE